MQSAAVLPLKFESSKRRRRRGETGESVFSFEGVEIEFVVFLRQDTKPFSFQPSVEIYQ